MTANIDPRFAAAHYQHDLHPAQAEPVGRKCQISDAVCDLQCGMRCKRGKDGVYLSPLPTDTTPPSTIGGKVADAATNCRRDKAINGIGAGNCGCLEVCKNAATPTKPDAKDAATPSVAGGRQNPKFTMAEWAAHARKYKWRFDTTTDESGVSQPSPPLADDLGDNAQVSDYPLEINRLRNVIQSACIGGMEAMAARWAQLFPDAGPLPDYSTDTADARRYRWLTADHDGPETRAKCRELIEHLSVKSYSAASADIDAAIASTKPEGKQ